MWILAIHSKEIEKKLFKEQTKYKYEHKYVCACVCMYVSEFKLQCWNLNTMKFWTDGAKQHTLSPVQEASVSLLT